MKDKTQKEGNISLDWLSKCKIIPRHRFMDMKCQELLQA